LIAVMGVGLAGCERAAGPVGKEVVEGGAVRLAARAAGAYSRADEPALLAALADLAAASADELRRVPVRVVDDSPAAGGNAADRGAKPAMANSFTIGRERLSLPGAERFREASGMVDRWVAEQTPSQAAAGLVGLDAVLRAVQAAAEAERAEHLYFSIGAIRAQTLTQLSGLGAAAPGDTAARLEAVRTSLKARGGRLPPTP
jgi:hypothetical protein